jgi:hypothetical protein
MYLDEGKRIQAGKEINGKSDQHSLAMTIYRHIFPWESPWKNGWKAEDSHDNVEQSLHFPKDKKITPGQKEVLRKATSFNPEDRYNTCIEFIQAFQAAKHNQQ